MVDIHFHIDITKINKLTNNSPIELNKLQCNIKNDNENIIELYSDINYIFSFPSNNTQTINSIVYGNYYFTIFENQNYNLDTTTTSDITYPYGLNKITISSDNIIKTTNKFKLIDKSKNYKWSIYKFNETKIIYEKYLSGKLIILDPLINIKLTSDGQTIIHDESYSSLYVDTKDFIYIDKNQNFKSNNLDILLYNNYNYIFELKYNEVVSYFDIYINKYEEYNKLNENQETNKISKLYSKNIPDTKKNKFIWNIKDSTSILISGNIIFSNLNKNIGNNEILYDSKFKNIGISYKLIYNKFLYNENLNIIKLNDFINNLLISYSNKLLIINNLNQNISIILPSKNIYIGLTYNIIFNININILNISCEDSIETLDNYDKIKGSLFISNKNNLHCKTISSSTEILDASTIQTDLSENIIIKKMSLNNGTTYNGGLYKYGTIKIICIEKLNNKYIWNIDGELLGNSIEFINSYLYNPFM